MFERLSTLRAVTLCQMAFGLTIVELSGAANGWYCCAFPTAHDAVSEFLSKH